MMRMSASACAQMAKATRATMPLEYVRMGCSNAEPMSAKAAIDAMRRSISLARQAEDGGADPGVLLTRQQAVESRSEREDRRYAPAHVEEALGRLRDAAQHLQQRRLARAIVADDADALALGDVEVHVGENPFLRIELLPKAEDDLLQLIVLMTIELKRLADAGAANDEIRRHQTTTGSMTTRSTTTGGQETKRRGRRTSGSGKLNDEGRSISFRWANLGGARGSRYIRARA